LRQPLFYIKIKEHILSVSNILYELYGEDLKQGRGKMKKNMFVMGNANFFVTELPHKYVFPTTNSYVTQLKADLTNLKPNSRVHQ
jgi:hypothetical protein